MEKVNYHVKESCNYCGGINDIEAVSYDANHVSECSTKCRDCKSTDYWSYGFFESSELIVGKCLTYNL